MKHPLELYCVRHASTAWNAEGRFQGWSDVALDDAGRAQARTLGRQLASIRFARIVCSDLRRATETAAIVAAGRRLAIALDADLREIRLGAWEGRRWTDLTAAEQSAPPEGGEAFDDVLARAGRALERIAASTPPASAVLVVTHAGVLPALCCIAGGFERERALEMHFPPASVTRLRLESRLVLPAREGAGDASALLETARPV